MYRCTLILFLFGFAASSSSVCGSYLHGQEPESKDRDSQKANAVESKATLISLSRDSIRLSAPPSWKQVKPRSRILDYEFSAPANAEEGEPTARITVMGAGGSIEANIARWYGQFTQPDGEPTKSVAKRDSFQVGESTVHFVDIPGTFADNMGGGPFSRGTLVTRKDYRMLGAIIVTKSRGQYFVKITGENKLLENLSKDFKKMLKGLEVK